MLSISHNTFMQTVPACEEMESLTDVLCCPTTASDWTIAFPQRDLASGQLIQFCDDPQMALPALMVHFKIRVTTCCWVSKGQEQLNLSLQPWSAVHCGVKSLRVYVCAWAHLAVNKRETLLTWHLSIFFFFTVAMWLDETQTMRFHCAYCWHAGQRGAAWLGSAWHWGGSGQETSTTGLNWPMSRRVVSHMCVWWKCNSCDHV